MDYLDRMKKEKEELDNKVNKLFSFIYENPAFYNIDIVEQKLLREQYHHMIMYQMTLTQRILIDCEKPKNKGFEAVKPRHFDITDGHLASMTEITFQWKDGLNISMRGDEDLSLLDNKPLAKTCYIIFPREILHMKPTEPAAYQRQVYAAVTVFLEKNGDVHSKIAEPSANNPY